MYASYIRSLTGKGLSFVALQRTLQDFISAHNWKEASKRMGDYMLSFDENAYQKPFEELRALLTAPAKKNSQAYVEYCPAYDIRNAVLHPNGKSLYYTREVGKMRSIWVAGKTSSKKSKWNSGSEVRFTNDPNSDLTIPDTVKSIGAEAFRGCNAMTSVAMGNSVTNIGEWAFFSCGSLTNVTFGGCVASIGEYAFYNCKGLMDVTIPDSVRSVGVGAFSGCSSLVSATLGKGVTSVGTWFPNCRYGVSRGW